MRRQSDTPMRRKLSRGAMAGLAIVVVTVGWIVYSFLGELATPPATQQVGDLEVSLYSTLTGRPRVGDNQFEVKLRDRQGSQMSKRPLAQCAVKALGRSKRWLLADGPMTGFVSMQGSTSCAWNGRQAWIIHGLVDAQPMEGGHT